MAIDQAEIERVNSIIAQQQVRFINLQFSDIVGIVKQVTIPSSQWRIATDHGIWFDGSSIEGFARVAESDMYLLPDLSTFAVIPWESDRLTTARVICDVYMPNGSPFTGDPRYILKRAVAGAAALGYIYNTGPELEFFLFKPGADGAPTTKPHDQAGYFDVSTDLAHNVRRQMVDALEVLGIEVEATHHEVAVGQHEVDFRYDDALRTADNVITLRTALKAIAQRNGLHCTFMPKPITNVNGSGMHTHQSLSDAKTGKNLFAAPNSPFGLSPLALHFIAGQLVHARGMSAILAPLVNSYKRLVPGFEAPTAISWARTNRSALIRVPHVSAERASSTRIELRCPDPAANPYLAFAVMLTAGLDGIQRKLDPPEPAEENLYHLTRRNLPAMPRSLGEALEEFKRAEAIQVALGAHLFERYVEAKTGEWEDYRRTVSRWEIERYLAIY